MSLCRRTLLVVPLGYLAACTTTRWYHAKPGIDRTLRVPMSELDPEGFVSVSAGNDDLLLVRENGVYTAVDLTCTHQGCAVSKRREQLVCPCHGSRFDMHGEVLRGPATRPLKTYTTEVDGDTVVIRL